MPVSERAPEILARRSPGATTTPATATTMMAGAATRGLAGLMVCLFVAFPVAAVFMEPAVALPFKAAWLGLAALAFVQPRWSPFVLVALVPLVPWLPTWSPRIPHGIVHLIVLSQALPLLTRYVFGRVRLAGDRLAWAWVLFIGVAVASTATHYLVYQVIFGSWPPFWAEVRTQLARYVFDRPNIEMQNMLLSTTALVDGLLTYLVVRAGVDRARLAPLLSAAALAAVGVSLFGFYQWWTRLGLNEMWTLYDPGITRINATYTDPNALASYFALTIPATLGLAARASGGQRLAWLGAVGIMGAGLIMTAGRAGMMATAVGVALLLALVILCGLDRVDPSPMLRRLFRKAVYGAAAAGLLLLTALIAAGTIFDVRHQQQTTYLHTWLFTFNLRQPLDQIVKGRLGNWETAALMVQDRPWFGVGVGRIYRVFPSYSRRVAGVPEGARLSAHNTFLNVAAEMGVVGLAAWLVLLGCALTLAVRALRRASAAEDRGRVCLLVGIVSGLAAYGVTMIPGDRLILHEDVVAFAALLAILACVHDESVASATPVVDRPRVGGIWLRRVAFAALVVITATIPLRVAAERRAVPLDRIAVGLHDIETSPHGRFRWTSGRATFHRSSTEAELTLQVRTVAPFAQTMTIRLNGDAVDRVVLADHAWRTLRYPLPARVKDAPYYTIDLNVTPTWRPPGDGRELGVMLRW